MTITVTLPPTPPECADDDLWIVTVEGGGSQAGSGDDVLVFPNVPCSPGNPVSVDAFYSCVEGDPPCPFEQNYTP